MEYKFNSRDRAIEALLYLMGDEGITLEQIKEMFELESIEVAQALMNRFIEKYTSEKRGLLVEEYNGFYKFVTNPECKEYIKKYVNDKQRSKLSDAAIEVVGIIAYKSPISRSNINAIRGKVSDHIVNALLLKGLIEEVGIAKSPGNPILYGVSNKFYDYFRIRSINELPRLTEFANIDLDPEAETQIIDLYSSQREDV